MTSLPSTHPTIPHSKLKDKLRELIELCFMKKNGQRSYKYIVLGRDRSYIVKNHSDSTKKFSETDIINMREFLIDNIFVIFGRLHTGASQEKRNEASPILWFDTTDTDSSASYLDLHLEIDSERRLRTKLYDKRDDFNFPIVNFPFICM